MLSSSKLTLGIVVGLGVADVLKHVLVISSGLMQPWGDAIAYWNLGTDIANGDVWMLDSAIGYRTLGYPWFVGICQLLGNSGGLLLVAIVQHVIALATNGLVAWGVWRSTNDLRWSAAAYALAIGNTSRAFYANWVLTESIATAMGLGICLLAWHRWRTVAWKEIIEVSLLIGGAILLRPSFLIFIPLLVAFLWNASLPRWKSWSLGFLVVGICVLPCSARNAYLFKTWKLVTFQGRELWTATFSPFPGAGLEIPQDGAGERLRTRLKHAAELDLRHNWGVSSALQRTGMSDAEIDQLMAEVALQAITQNRFEVSKAFCARILTFWYCWNWPSPKVEQSPIAIAEQFGHDGLPAAQKIAARLAWTPEYFRWSTVLFSLLTLLSAAVLAISRDLRLPGSIALYYMLASTVLTAALEIPNYRYRMPLEPVQVFVIATAAFMLWRQRKGLLGS